MDIKLLPNITVIPVNDNRATQKNSPQKLRLKGKVLHTRPSRGSENGRTIITIITDTPEHQLSDIINADVTILT